MIIIWIQDFSSSYPLQLISSLQAVFKLTFKSQIYFSLLHFFIVIFFSLKARWLNSLNEKIVWENWIIKFNWKLMLHKSSRTTINVSFSSETISQRLKQIKYRCCITSKLSEGLPLGSNLSLIFILELPGNWNSSG